ncbi:MAG: homocysteine S-methyltransferase family protein [Anaerolineales bacterium]|nr:homocysteine S-methyltransferase family protein [Anaerolineales bacterium]
MSTFIDRLAAGQVLVADGATGTNLHRMGLQAGISPEELVLDHPELLLRLAGAFVEAGSDLILTCTFGGSSLRLQETRYAGRAAEINLRAAALARQAASARPGVLVGGSIGPLGKLLKPYGPVNAEDALRSLTEQARALADGGVDMLVIETQFDLEEAKLAVQAAQSQTDLPIVISFSYDRGVRTMMGVKPSQVVETFVPLGVAVIGANCGTTLENMHKIVSEYASLTTLPVWAKPNAGLPVLNPETGETEYHITPEQMADFALQYIRAGARIVGGCCGSTPEHVQAIARAVHGTAAGA